MHSAVSSTYICETSMQTEIYCVAQGGVFGTNTQSVLGGGSETDSCRSSYVAHFCSLSDFSDCFLSLEMFLENARNFVGTCTYDGEPVAPTLCISQLVVVV